MVFPLTDFIDRFESLDSVVVEADPVRRVAVVAVKTHGKQLIVKLEGVDSRTEAERLKGVFLSVPRSEVAAIEGDRIYQFEIVGMKVVAESGEELGVIKEVVEMPANDLWRVEGKRSFSMPATANIVLNVDRQSRVVTIRLIDGLLDLES